MSNLGNLDRWIRIAIAIVLLGLGWGGIVTGTAGTVLKFLGFVPLATAAIGFCPLYRPLGLSTGRKS
ncbi:MAG TPA: DUF2892 domain-containing protein [Fibrobacteria bacterium]|nr:DUF2892 domain-containing protein [Fibrobacteria bacterium]HOX53149.1 DUF2892 domain-containing protein [Fibrobacteria bacterium]